MPDVCSEAVVTTENDVSLEDSSGRQKRTATGNVMQNQSSLTAKEETWREVFLQVSVTRSL